LLDSFWSGVDIFFVLSGFLIGGIILDEGRSGNFLHVFYVRRALRILPVALLTIAFSYFVIPLLHPGLARQAQVPPYAYLLFINNFWTANLFDAYAPLGPMWSLAIEEQFYLLAPAFILLTPARARNLALAGIVLISPFLRLCELGVSSWDFTFLRLDGLSAGILVATLVRAERLRTLFVQNRRGINGAVAGITATALLFTVIPHSGREQVAFGVSLNSLAAAGAVLFMHLNRTSLLSRALSQRWLVITGEWSYFLYLMHMPILLCVREIPGLNGPLYPLLALGICLPCAWASRRFIESPLIGIGKRFSYRSPAKDSEIRPDVVPIGTQA
jgi:peptidoglycan/LPS O-acetylase OafA/YrhL